MAATHEPIPRDFQVQPLRSLKQREEAKELYSCGHCGLYWDNAVQTDYTPAPSARCPFEYFHVYTSDEDRDLLRAEYRNQQALYTKDDPDRNRFALHNLVANLMEIGDDEKVDLVNVITGGVELYAQRGSPNELPGQAPKEFFRWCARVAD